MTTRAVVWDKVTEADVMRAIEEHDRVGPAQFFATHGFDPTTTYDLVWEQPPTRRRCSAGSA